MIREWLVKSHGWATGDARSFAEGRLDVVEGEASDFASDACAKIAGLRANVASADLDLRSEAMMNARTHV